MAYQPKSYKKFVATAATATLVATAVVPAAFADEAKTAAFTDVPASYAPAVDFVVEQAIAKGISETKFGIPLDIKRGDAAIMIANAAEINDPNAPSSGFTDVPTRGALAINSLKAAGVTNGKTTTSFDFDGSITRGEAAIFLANAFDLEGDTKNVKFTDVNDRYIAAVAALVDNDVTNGKSATSFGTGDELTRGEFAKWLYALKDLIVDPVTPEVASIEITDANTIVVKFNVSLDKESVENDGFFEVNGTNAVATLGADGKTVTLEVPVLTNNSEVEVRVEKELLTAAGEEFAEVDVVRNIIFSDSVVPAVSAISTPDSKLRIAFSEDLSDPTNANKIAIIVNGKSVELGADQAAWVTGNVVELPATTVASLGLTAGTSYPVVIAGARDLVGNEMALYSGNFTFQVVTDTTAPSVTEVKALDENSVNVKFSEELTDVSNLQPTFSVKRNGNVITTNASASTTDGVNYVVDLSAYQAELYPENQTTAPLEITISGARDISNNVGVVTTKSVTLTEDLTNPAFVSASYSTTTKTASLKFNENIVDSLNNETDIVVVNTATSQEVSGLTTTVNTDTDSIEIVGLPAGATYSVRVDAGYVVDTSVAANKNAGFTTTVSVPATPVSQPQVVAQSATASLVDSDELFVNFSQPVVGGTGSNSAANPANYLLDGKALPAGTLITLDAESDQAFIELPNGSIETTHTAVLTVKNVAAVNGTVVETTNLLVPVTDTKSPVLTSAKVNGSELVLTFTEDIATSTFQAEDFVTKVNGVEVNETIAAGDAVNQLKITTSDANLATGTVTVEVAASADAEDEAGNVIVTGTIVTATR